MTQERPDIAYSRLLENTSEAGYEASRGTVDGRRQSSTARLKHLVLIVLPPRPDHETMRPRMYRAVAPAPQKGVPVPWPVLPYCTVSIRGIPFDLSIGGKHLNSMNGGPSMASRSVATSVGKIIGRSYAMWESLSLIHI